MHVATSSNIVTRVDVGTIFVTYKCFHCEDGFSFFERVKYALHAKFVKTYVLGWFLI